MIYKVRFEHPFVGYKGSATYLTLEADSAEDAIAKVKQHKEFMKYVNGYNQKDYPIKDGYFHAYEAPKAKIGELRHFEGDERL